MYVYVLCCHIIFIEIKWSVFIISLGIDTRYIGVLISLWLFLFAAQPKELFLDGLKKLEQRSHKCVELRVNMWSEYIFSHPCIF
jgi:hypothetical protein